MLGSQNQPHLRWVHWRPWVQGSCLALFLGLGLGLHLGWRLGLPADAFLRLDPLLWLTGSLASRTWLAYSALAFGMLVASALWGRVFCGWVCPLGTAQDAAAAVRPRNTGLEIPAQVHATRFVVLAALAGAALAGLNLAGWLDPLALSARAIHLVVRPQVGLSAAAVAAAVVAVVIGLSRLAPRLWCRVLCPLGALLSVVSSLARWRSRPSAACQACGACRRACPMGRGPRDYSPALCLVCGRCQAACPQEAVSLQFSLKFGRSAQPRAQPVSAGVRRRWALLGVGAFVLGSTLRLWGRHTSNSVLLRPPGAQPEELFVARCVGCGACVAVCPTGGLQPMLSVARLDALFTPRLVPRQGPCKPECIACGSACFSGAIARVAPEQKPKLRIGVAVLDQARCLPWAKGERCVVCVDACPPEYAAIRLRPIAPGQFRPEVEAARCTGCGLCEYRCPLPGAAAIRVVPAL